jgi:large subunit ribosomal protein L35
MGSSWMGGAGSADFVGPMRWNWSWRGCGGFATLCDSARPGPIGGAQSFTDRQDLIRAGTEPNLDWIMPKLKTHKGLKKRFKVSATGKVSHKRCGSSHLMSHKSGKQVRRLRKKVQLSVSAEASRIRKAIRVRISSQPDAILAARLQAMRELADEAAAPAATPTA